MKRYSIKTILRMSWRILSTTAIITLGIALLLFSQLDTLMNGYALVEVETAQTARSIQTIVDNPINAPYKLTVFAITSLINDPLLAVRITSVIFGAVSIILFYIIMRLVHSKRIAFLSGIVFAASSWFLHIARIGTPDIMLIFSVITFAVAGYWIARGNGKPLSVIAAVLVLGMSVFVPGMIWFIAAGLLIRRTKDLKAIHENLAMWQKIGVTFALFAFVLLPLAWAIVNTPALGLTLLGLPDSVPVWSELLKNLVLVPVSLFIISPENPVMWLGRLPLLDIALSALLVLGVYYYFKFRSLDRSKLLAIFIVGASILIAFDNGVTNAMLLPAAYVGVAGGIALLTTQWFTVFPRNPLAQSVGMIIITVIIAVSGIYSLRSYFVAWPHWAPAKASFTKTEANLVQ